MKAIEVNFCRYTKRFFALNHVALINDNHRFVGGVQLMRFDLVQMLYNCYLSKRIFHEIFIVKIHSKPGTMFANVGKMLPQA